MLRALRNQTKSIFFKCFLVLLICGFALWGVGDLTGGSKGKIILTVENQNITVEEALNEINRARYLLPDRPSLEEAIKNGLHNGVLNKFEQEILINQEAKSLNLNVPLSEQMKSIRKENAFKDALGKFSQNKFNQALNNVGLTENKYLEMIKTESNFKQVSMPFIFNEYYNEKIIKKIIDWQNQLRVVEYDVFKILSENEIPKPSDIILKNFYDKNKKLFEIPLTRDIKYIEINPSHFESLVTISDKQIEEKYEIEKYNYITEEKREILQITTQNESKLNKFITLTKKGKQFDDLAKVEFNLLKSDTNLGFLKKSDLPPESADLIFNANLNEIIGPIKTKFGFSLYKIINIDPQKQIAYKEAIKDIKKNLMKELSLDILYEKIDNIEDLIAEGNTIEEISRSEVFKRSIKVKNLKKISKVGLIYSYNKDSNLIDKNKEFLKSIWNTEINELSRIFSNNDDIYYLIEVMGETKKEIPIFNLTKSKVYNHWFKQQSLVMSKEKANNILKLKNNKLSMTSSLKRNDKKFGKLYDPILINKIFEIDNKKINFLVSQDNLLAIKIKKIETDDYVFNIKNYEDLNVSFSKSFFNDFSNFFIQNLATKHKLKRNYEELNNYFVNLENKN